MLQNSYNISQTNFLKYKPSKKEEGLIKRQKGCTHDYFITRCSQCNKILGSDHQLNVEKEECLVNNNNILKNTISLSDKQACQYDNTQLFLERESETEYLVASYTFVDIQVLKGQIKVIFGKPFEELSKQTNLTAGERLRLTKNQSYQIKPIKNGATISIIKINI